MMNRDQVLRRRIRPLLILFALGLVLSGITAFPLETEVRYLADLLGVDESVDAGSSSGLQLWIKKVRDGLTETNSRYPFMAYGTDWLAFGHLMIAVAFMGPIRDPWRNEWVVTFGVICCIAVVPMAMIAGSIRGIPFWWRVIDCSFGVFGLVPLIAVKWYLRNAPDSIDRAGGVATSGTEDAENTMSMQPAP